MVLNSTSGALSAGAASSAMSLSCSLFVLSLLTVLALVGAETHHLWILLLGSLTLGLILLAVDRPQPSR